MKVYEAVRFHLVAAALLALTSTAARADDVSVTVDTAPSGLALTVDGANYTAPAIFIWTPGDAHTISIGDTQLSGDGHARYSFASWSDGGNQTNQIITPTTNALYIASLSVAYLLDTTVSPSDSSTVTAAPTGPWYASNTVVTLTGVTNSLYRVNYWQGVDTATGRVAQVTMNGYRLVQAIFIPADYPYYSATNAGGAAPGDVIGNIGGRNADGTKTYYVVLDNTGTNLIYANKTNVILRFVTPHGFLTANDASGFHFKDETVTNIVDTSSTSGYTLDTHDVKLFPNGHTFVFGTEVRAFDMSGVVAGGKTSASITGDIIQELDGNKRVVFEWHTFDFIAITNTFADMTQSSFDYAHVNAISIDPTDNNLLASVRTTSEIVKISRQTGQILWHLGGKKNQFAFIGEHAENAPYYTVGQHDIHRLPNGHLLYFDNGNISGGGVTPSDRTYSRAVEYALDETNMTATLVWEFRHTPDISAPCTGSVKRYANGDTTIDWGCAVPTSGTILTEVNSAGQVVFELQHRTNNGLSSVLLGGGVTKQLWNTADLIRSTNFPGIQSGQTYNASAAGVSVIVNSLSGTPDNALTVERHLDAVRLAKFSGKAPQVVMEHVILGSSNISSMQVQLNFALPDTTNAFDTPVIHDPAQMVVYQRPVPGQGLFTALPTTYDSGTQTLQITTAQTGEFIFGYPDVGETPYVPTILSPANQGQIAQAQAITLVWVPTGLVGSFDLQIATDSGFSNLVLDTNNLGATSCSVQNLSINTQYYWRVRTENQGGISDWATASFTPVPPVLQLTYPGGGEVWQRFQVVTIRWTGNISDNVALDLYMNGVSNRTFVASTPGSSGGYSWTVGQFSALPFSTNYTIKIRSLSNPAVYNFSQPFAIITNVPAITISTVPPNLAITVDGTNYTAPAIFSWLPSSLHTLNVASPQVAANGHSRSIFSAWTDGGAQSHSMTTPFFATTNYASFSTNYLLDIAVTPPGAGTAVVDPSGFWYPGGQQVSLTANTNGGYLFYTWQGVATQVNNTAQLTMNGYNSVQAQFIPVSGVPFIDGASFTRLPDGRVQFNLTAGAGFTTQATVWGATTLSPPDWQIIGTVPLIGSSGVFIEDPAPTAPNRFYRVSLP